MVYYIINITSLVVYLQYFTGIVHDTVSPLNFARFAVCIAIINTLAGRIINLGLLYELHFSMQPFWNFSPSERTFLGDDPPIFLLLHG